MTQKTIDELLAVSHKLLDTVDNSPVSDDAFLAGVQVAQVYATLALVESNELQTKAIERQTQALIAIHNIRYPTMTVDGEDF